MLCRSGFSGVDLEFVDDHDPIAHQHSTIISTATENPQKAITNPLQGLLKIGPPYLLISEHSDLQRTIAKDLKSKLELEGSMDCTIGNLDKALATNTANRSCYIVLLELEKNVLSQLDPQSFEQLQELMVRASGIL